MKNVVALALLLSLATACGGTVVFEDEGEGDAGGGGDGGAGAVGPTGGPSGPTGSITVAVGSDATQGSGAGGFGTGGFGTGGFGGDVEVIRVEAQMGANCMPVVGPDPMSGVVIVDYENPSAEAGSLSIARADVIFSNRFEGWVFPIELAPTSSGDVPAGGTASVEHQKVASEGDSSFLCQLCGAPGSITLRFRRPDGDEFDASGPLTLGCAF